MKFMLVHLKMPRQEIRQWETITRLSYFMSICEWIMQHFEIVNCIWLKFHVELLRHWNKVENIQANKRTIYISSSNSSSSDWQRSQYCVAHVCLYKCIAFFLPQWKWILLLNFNGFNIHSTTSIIYFNSKLFFVCGFQATDMPRIDLFEFFPHSKRMDVENGQKSHPETVVSRFRWQFRYFLWKQHVFFF